MRRLIPIVSFVALLATACGSSGGGGGATTGKAGDVGPVGSLPAVTGEAGAKPSIATPKGKPVTELAVKVLSEGTGIALAAGDPVIVNYLGITWPGVEFDNSFDRQSTFSFTLGKSEVIPGWDQALVGKKVGSRLELGIPPGLAYGAQGNGSIGPNETLVFVVDIVAGFTKGQAATGTAVALDDPALPKVTGEAATLAVVPPAGAPAPTALVAKTLIEGTGPVVAKGQNIGVQYVGALWDGGKVFDASWARDGAPVVFPIGVGRVIPGWDEGLVGVKAGSRVLLVIPADKAYGAEGRPPTIPANAALVFVVDVLGAG